MLWEYRSEVSESAVGYSGKMKRNVLGWWRSSAWGSSLAKGWPRDLHIIWILAMSTLGKGVIHGDLVMLQKGLCATSRSQDLEGTKKPLRL